MAAEWWDPQAQMRERLAACGHTIFVRDRPTAFPQNGMDMFKCPECACVQSPTTNARDGVPSESLAWGEARCTRRLTFTKHQPDKVRTLYLPYRMMQGSSRVCVHIGTQQLAMGVTIAGAPGVQ